MRDGGRQRSRESIGFGIGEIEDFWSIKIAEMVCLVGGGQLRWSTTRGRIARRTTTRTRRRSWTSG